MRYDVCEFGIVGDGKTNNTEAIKKLIEKIRASGGELYFPPGEYVTGTIRLFDNMNVYLEKGAKILGSDDFSDYPKIDEKEVSGYTRCGYSGLITAIGCENIGIFGEGEIDGRGYNWWQKLPSDTMRPRTINPILCKNVTISGISVKNSPCWSVHPMCSENVVIENVSVINPPDSPNTDGINPESCKNVRISGCFIDVGDDCITIKSGTEDDILQKSHPCEDIIVENCTMMHGHGGVVIGSEMSGGVKNVTVENCKFFKTDRGIRLKTRRKRGGCVENISFSGIEMDGVLAAVTFNEYYICGAKPDDAELFSNEKMPVGADTPKISGVSIRDIKAQNVGGVGIYMLGLPEAPIFDITMENMEISVAGSEEGVDAVMAPGRAKSYGEGIFIENAENVKINNITITCPGEKIVTKNCKNIFINGEKM